MSENAGDIEKLLLSFGIDSVTLAQVKTLKRRFEEVQKVTGEIKRDISNFNLPAGTGFITRHGVKAEAAGRGTPQHTTDIARETKALNSVVGSFKTKAADFTETLGRLNKDQLGKLHIGIKKFTDELNHSSQKINRNAAQAEKDRKAQAAAERRRNSAGGVILSPQQKAEKLNAQLQAERQKNLVRRSQDGGAGLLRNQALLLRNYALLGGGVGAGYSAGSFIVDLDKSFKQLQSIVALTNTEMVELEQTLISVSEKTKFTAVEVAEAAVVLGQAGFGKDQISAALEGVTLFATAVGTDLKTAVDLATSTLGVYNKSADQMTNIVDKMTVAINNSKLNMDKLSLGLQYAGNIAAQSNVSFEETVATLAAMANSGIRAGSTLGTGLRQILIALQKPSDELKRTLFNLGIGFGEIDLKTHGLIGVMKNLAKGGFTVSDAMKTMQVRAGAAFSAFVNNIDVAEDISTQMEIGGAATKANAVQMQALSNQWAKFGSIIKSVAYEAFEPLLKTLTSIVSVLGDMGSGLKKLGPLLPIIGTAVGTFLTIGAIKGIGKLVKNLFKDGSILRNFGASLAGGAAVKGGKDFVGPMQPKKGVSGFFKSLGGKSGIVKVIAGVLGLLGGWAGLIAAVVATVGYAGLVAIKGKDPLDESKARFSKIDSELDKQKALAKKVTQNVTKLYERQNILTEGDAAPALLTKQIKELNDEFKNVGFYVDESTTSFGELIKKLQELKTKAIDKIVSVSPEVVESLATLSTERIKKVFEGSGGNIANLAKGSFRSYRGSGGLKFLETIIGKGSQEKFKDLRYQTLRINPKDPEAQNQYKALVKAYSEILAKVNTDKSFRGEGYTDSQAEVVDDFSSSLNNIIENLAQVAHENRIIQGNLLDENGNTKVKLQAQLENKLQQEFTDPLSQRKAETKNILDELEERHLDKQDIRTSYDIYKQTQELLKENESKRKETEAKFAEFLTGEGIEVKSLEGAALSNKYLEPILNGIEKDFKNLLDSLYNPAKKVFNAEASAELEAVKAERKVLLDRRSDSLDEDTINQLTPLIQALNDRENKIEIEVEKINLNDAGSNAFIESKLQYQNEEDKKADDLEASKQLEYARIYRELNDGTFTGRNKDSKITDKELGKVALLYMKHKRAEIDIAFEEAQKELEDYDQKDLRLQLSRKITQRTLGDSGAFQADRLEASVAASRTDDAVFQNQREKLGHQIANLATQYRANAELIKREQLILDDLSNKGQTDPKLLDKVNGVKKTNEKIEQDILNLQTDLSKVEVDQADKRFERIGENLAIQRSRSNYMSDEHLARNSYIQGTGYQSVLGQQYEARTEANGMFDELNNAYSFSMTDLDDYYEGFSVLGELTAGITAQAKGMGDAFGQAFMDFADGSKSAKEAGRDFLLGFLGDLARVASQVAANYLMTQILGYFMPSVGGNPTGNGNTGAPIGPHQTPTGPTGFQGRFITAGGYYDGGLITTGTSARDSVYAKVAKGEFVLRKAAVDALGMDSVRALNGLDPHNITSTSSMTGIANRNPTPSGEKSVNVWVVTPDQKPNTLGPNDIVAVVGDNIARDGSLKQLIKKINMREL